MTTLFESVPVIDLSIYTHGNLAQRRAVAAEVDRVNREIGFLVITGHDFDMGLLERWIAVSREFFEGAPEIKEALTAPEGVQHGYHRVGESGLAAKEGEKAPPDLREYFMVGPVAADNTCNFHRQNMWPSSPPGFAQTAADYYAAMEALGARLMSVFAAVLGLPENWFDDKIDHHFSIVSTIYYPAQQAKPLPGQMRAGAHTDYGSLTILAPTKSSGGLQVRLRNGHWVDVPLIPDGFVVNIGDMMQRWTNDRWLSNLHRVVNPDHSVQPVRPRQSVAYFLHPNHDAVIECIPSCTTPGIPARHAPILAGQYMKAKETAIATATPEAVLVSVGLS